MMVIKTPKCYVGGVGASMRSPCVLLPAATSIRLVGTTPAAFAVCQD